MRRSLIVDHVIGCSMVMMVIGARDRNGVILGHEPGHHLRPISPTTQFQLFRGLFKETLPAIAPELHLRQDLIDNSNKSQPLLRRVNPPLISQNEALQFPQIVEIPKSICWWLHFALSTPRNFPRVHSTLELAKPPRQFPPANLPPEPQAKLAPKVPFLIERPLPNLEKAPVFPTFFRLLPCTLGVNASGAV